MKAIRRGAALLLTLLLLVTPLSAAGAAFSDVPTSHWAYESVRRAAEIGLVRGNGSGVFGFGRVVTRAEYATMLCRLMDWELVAPEAGSFGDNQDKDAWYYAAIETAYLHGALLRFNASCEPNAPITREEMASILVRALDYSALAGMVQADCPFDDVTTNRGYMALAYRMGLVNGTGERTFAPSDKCTREQAAVVLLRAYERMHGEIATSTDAAPDGAVFARPLAGYETPVPMSPRAPLESVYEAAVKAGVGGAVALYAAPCVQSVKNGAVTDDLSYLTDEALAALFDDAASRTYHSARYQSSYLLRPEADGSTTVAWYETEEDIEAKVELCRLMGIKTVYVAE